MKKIRKIRILDLWLRPCTEKLSISCVRNAKHRKATDKASARNVWARPQLSLASWLCSSAESTDR